MADALRRELVYFIILSLCARIASSTVPHASSSMQPREDTELYSSKPTEILPIQPILLYPLTNEKLQQGRALFEDDKIIYVKLLKRKNYRPQKIKQPIYEKHFSKDIQMKDIFYVKALTNGQFSHNRLKLYRLPEFYAIAVYKKGEFTKKKTRMAVN